MRRFLMLFLLISSLFLAGGFFRDSQVQAQSPDHYSLQLQGFIWDQTTLNTLMVIPENETWWNPLYLNSTLRAIGQWNEAIVNFASNHSDFAYLSSLTIAPTVVNVTQPGFDIYVNWTESSLSDVSDEVGLSTTFTDQRRTIVNCTVTLAAHTNHGDPLNEGDAQNIALHELGHALGLGHSNYTDDLMYPMYTLRGGAEQISTLDVYGVAKVFAWQLNASNIYPVSRWFTENSVVLPSNGIVYRYLPVSPENARPQTIANNPVIQTIVLMFQILLHPEILSIVIIVTSIFVVVAVIQRKRKR